MKNNESATGLTYKFSTFQELVDRVPGDRIRDCFEELGTTLATAKLTTELLVGVARNIAASEGNNLPLDGEQVIKIPSEFEWIDDGKRNLEAAITGPDGKPLMSVRVSKVAESDAESPAPHPSPDLTRLKQALADEICDDQIINRLPLQDLIWLNGLIHTALATAVSAATEPLRREVETIKAVLADPNAVWVNMLRGQIATPTQWERERERLVAANDDIQRLTAEINRLKGEK